MTRTMYDSVTPFTTIPKKGATMVAWYRTGGFAVEPVGNVSADERIARSFPGWSSIPIDTNGTSPGNSRVADVEKFDMTPAETEGWIERWNAENPAYHNGGRPVIYCTRDAIPDVRTGTGRYILARDYYLWIATLDGTLYTGAGVIACQRWDMGGYDESTVYSAQWVPS
jgi:hypothetical protein